MRICFFGTPEPAVPSLRAFLNAPGIEVAAVVTNPDRPRGRGHRLAPPPVKVAAAEAGVDVWQPVKPREIVEDLRGLQVDACAIVAYGSILPTAVLDVGGKGFVNLHFSLLPAWRGAAPVQHSVLAGDRETGVTCFVLDAGMDTGPILNAVRTSVGHETAGELTARLAELGAPALVEAVAGFVAGNLQPQPQPSDGATYASKVTAEDAQLDWDAPAHRLDCAVRAFNPAPGAHTTLDGQRLKIHRARPVDGQGEPGSVLGVEEDAGPVVACGAQALLLEEVQPAGKARMSGLDFANGYRPVGKRLGGQA